MSRVFRFAEPHYTGGVSITTITEEQILKHQKARPEYKGRAFTDGDLLLDFVALHWAWEVNLESEEPQ